MPKQKITTLIATTVPLVLSVDEGKFVLTLKLAWTMRAVCRMEVALAELGVTDIKGRKVNILQNPSLFWTELDSVRLAVAVWSLAHDQPENPDVEGEEGLKAIQSYMTPDNTDTAVEGIYNAYVESLSPARQAELKKVKEDKKKALVEGGNTNQDERPTPAPTQQ